MEWFKHDINSLMDDRLSALVQRFAANGYAVYFCVVEALYANEGLAVGRLVLQRISKEFGIPLDSVVEICDYAASADCDHLLHKVEGGYASERVCKAIQEKDEITRKKKEGLRRRWDKYRSNKALPTTNDASESIDIYKTSNRDVIEVYKKSSSDVIDNPTEERREDKSRGDEKEKPTVSNEPVGKEKCEDEPASRPGNRMPEIVLKDGSRWTPPETYIATKQKAYPAVDVMAELWKMEGKTSQRPQSRPLPFNLDGFVNGWLDNAVRDMDRPRARDPDRRIVTDHEERMKGVNPDGTYTI